MKRNLTIAILAGLILARPAQAINLGDILRSPLEKLSQLSKKDLPLEHMGPAVKISTGLLGFAFTLITWSIIGAGKSGDSGVGLPFLGMVSATPFIGISFMVPPVVFVYDFFKKYPYNFTKFDLSKKEFMSYQQENY